MRIKIGASISEKSFSILQKAIKDKACIGVSDCLDKIIEEWEAKK